VADTGVINITAVVRGPITASCVVAGVCDISHNLSATGHMTIPNAVLQTNSGAFDITTAGISAGVCLTSGASDAITIQQVTAEVLNI